MYGSILKDLISNTLCIKLKLYFLTTWQFTMISHVCSGRKFKWYRYVGTVLLTAAFSIISALVSKALTLGLLALILTLMGRGGAGFGFSNLSSSPHAAAVPVPAYRTPLYAPLPLRAQLTSAAEMQYMDETDDLTNPYVYVNRKSLKAARSDGFGKYSSRYWLYEWREIGEDNFSSGNIVCIDVTMHLTHIYFCLQQH